MDWVYLSKARRALRALRGLVRLKSLIHGQSVKRQATTTLRCMQTLARVQSQIRARRIRMSEENQALQRQLQQKHEKELEKSRAPVTVEEDWNASMRTKDQLEANLQSKQEAAIRRERALAYAHSHQQVLKNSSKSATPTFMDPNNPHWGWSWLERWMASRPWENRGSQDRDLNSDHASMKSATSHAISVGELKKSHSSCQSPSTPHSKVAAPPVATRTRPPASPNVGSGCGRDEDSRSMLSFRSEWHRRHSIAGSSVRDDESLASSPAAVPSYMVPTESAKAKSRLPSPLGNGTPEKGSVGSAKKRLSFSPSSPAGTRRHSGPPKLDTGSLKDVTLLSENKNGNGRGQIVQAT
ncbi:hypothetical protein U1Q18_026053 [Sarracenia purpurea var. burkii]